MSELPALQAAGSRLVVVRLCVVVKGVVPDSRTGPPRAPERRLKYSRLSLGAAGQSPRGEIAYPPRMLATSVRAFSCLSYAALALCRATVIRESHSHKDIGG
jgi:hypothetical protein